MEPARSVGSVGRACYLYGRKGFGESAHEGNGRIGFWVSCQTVLLDIIYLFFSSIVIGALNVCLGRHAYAWGGWAVGNYSDEALLDGVRQGRKFAWGYIWVKLLGREILVVVVVRPLNLVAGALVTCKEV